jgi:glycine amidinotransferase
VRDLVIAIDDHLIVGSPRQPSEQSIIQGKQSPPFLEGSDVLLNGNQVYVGMSGNASDFGGIDWLTALLGPDYRVVPVALRSNTTHLDWCLTLIRPGVLIHCPHRLIDGLPMAVRDWDKIEISSDEAGALAAHVLNLDEKRVIADASNTRVIAELEKRGVQVIRHSGPVRSASAPLKRG